MRDKEECSLCYFICLLNYGSCIEDTKARQPELNGLRHHIFHPKPENLRYEFSLIYSKFLLCLAVVKYYYSLDFQHYFCKEQLWGSWESSPFYNFIFHFHIVNDFGQFSLNKRIYSYIIQYNKANLVLCQI